MGPLVAFRKHGDFELDIHTRFKCADDCLHILYFPAGSSTSQYVSLICCLRSVCQITCSFYVML